MSDAYLALYFDAPMQSWGYLSRFDRRNSGGWPTKSGVMGLLCAAAGVDRSDDKALENLSRLKMTVLVIQEPSSRWMDFHTVGGGYKADSRRMAKKANLNKPTTTVTYREYLADAKFGLILEGDLELIDKYATAVQNPKWGIWFGRKSCIPASPIFSGVFSKYNLAVEELLKHTDKRRLRVVKDLDFPESDSFRMMDVPKNFLTREFSTRYISEDIEDQDADF